MESGTVNGLTEIDRIINKTLSNQNKRKTGELGKDEFLNLLVTQLKYQDPLEPMDDKEFISQMAQFSSLEQMQNVNRSISALKAFSLIGKYVYTDTNNAEGINKSEYVEGEVTGVKISAGSIYLVTGEQDIPMDNVISVTDVKVQENENDVL
jgi:flagellar basal-body rod modification protein FlgD